MSNVTDGSALQLCTLAVEVLNDHLPDFLETFEDSFAITLPAPETVNVYIGNRFRQSTDGTWLQVFFWPGASTMVPAAIGPDYLVQTQLRATLIADADVFGVDDTAAADVALLAYSEAVAQAVSSYLVEADTTKCIKRSDMLTSTPAPSQVEIQGDNTTWRVQVVEIVWNIMRTTPFLVAQDPT